MKPKRLLVALLALLLTGCIHPLGINIAPEPYPNSISLHVGEHRFYATHGWRTSSNNQDICIVQDGHITGIHAGHAQVFMVSPESLTDTRVIPVEVK